jgi:outer membrane protein, heavy metal efflux system
MLVAALVVYPVTCPAYAQGPSPDTVRLTSQEAVARALVESPEIVRQRLAIDRARAERLRVSNFFPSLPEAEYSRTTDAPFNAKGEGEWEIGLTQEIEIGGQSFLRRNAAEAGVAQTELEVRAAELALRAEVRGAFARLAAAEARVHLLDTLVGFARRLDTIAGRLLGAEEISELDRNTVRIERGRAEIERLNAMTSVVDAQSDMAGLLGLPSGTIVTTTPSLADPSFVRSTLDTVSLIETQLAAGDESVMQRRPDWRAIERGRERLRLERSLAGRAWIPNIQLGLSLRNEIVLDGEDISGGSEAIRNDKSLGFHIGMQVPLPLPGLYNFGSGDVAIADVEMASLDAERHVLVARVRADVARAAGRLRNAARAYEIYTVEIAPLVRRNLELLERGYVAGELGATQVITEQEQILRTGEALIEAELEFNEALADFDRAVGRADSTR